MNRLLTLAVVAFFSAWVATGAVDVKAAGLTALDGKKSAGVEVTSAVPDKAESANALKQAIVAQLVSKNVFKALTASNAADYQVKVNILSVSEVAQGVRILLGAFAGKAEISTQVDVFDSKAGKSMGNFVAKGKSSSGTIFAGTTQEAIDQAAAQIADHLLANRLP